MSATAVLLLVPVALCLLALSYAFIRYHQICKHADEGDGS